MEDYEFGSILAARLNALPPEAAVEALRQRNQKRKGVSRLLRSVDSARSPEMVLLARREPLIDLGLAEYGMDAGVLKELYRRSLGGTGDTVLDMGIRIGVLANRLAPDRFFETNPVMDPEELARLATEGSDDEVTAMLTNPVARSYVGDLYRRKPPFDSQADDRYHSLVDASIRNPWLTFDDGTEDGPDLILSSICTGIHRLLSTAPATPRWLWTLNYLLHQCMPKSLYYGNQDPAHVINRWKPVHIKAFNSEDSEKGQYTGLSMTDEFCCRVAAMSGSFLENGHFKSPGSVDSQDFVMRCAYYGNHSMKPDEMRTADEKDGPIFTFAALHNAHFYWNRSCRAALESMLVGNQFDLYTVSCERLADVDKRFDPTPITDNIAEKEAPSNTVDRLKVSIGQLDERLAAMQNDMSRSKTLGYVTLALVIAALWHSFK